MNDGRAWSPQELAVLRRVLAELFPREPDQRRFVADLSLPVSTIAFDPSAENTWFSILQRARQTVGVDALLQHALTTDEGRHHRDLLRFAEGVGLASQSSSSPSASPSPSTSGSLSPSREASTLRFLHLTDWHVGLAEQGWLWPNVREAFFDDLARLHERLGGLDAVFFTGDLTQRGSADEFAKLDEGLAALWTRLAELGSDPVLVAVPGNHDLVRPPPKGAAVKALGAWHADTDIRSEFWSEPEGDYRRCVRSAFAPYAAWAERQSAMKRAEPRQGALPGDVAAVLERGGLRVGVVGLNSAFLQLTDADYERKLELDVRQLHAACGGDAPAWLKQNDLNLLLTHHPSSWLEPTRLKSHFETEIAPPGRFVLHLHGHLHEPGAHAETVGGSHARHRLAGPSLFGLERFERPGGIGEERLHGYTAGRIELLAAQGTAVEKSSARVRLWPRRLVTKRSGARRMERDGDFELEADESFTFVVSCDHSRQGGASRLGPSVGPPPKPGVRSEDVTGVTYARPGQAAPREAPNGEAAKASTPPKAKGRTTQERPEASDVAPASSFGQRVDAASEPAQSLPSRQDEPPGALPADAPTPGSPTQSGERVDRNGVKPNGQAGDASQGDATSSVVRKNEVGVEGGAGGSGAGGTRPIAWVIGAVIAIAALTVAGLLGDRIFPKKMPPQTPPSKFAECVGRLFEQKNIGTRQEGVKIGASAQGQIDLSNQETREVLMQALSSDERMAIINHCSSEAHIDDTALLTKVTVKYENDAPAPGVHVSNGAASKVAPEACETESRGTCRLAFTPRGPGAPYRMDVDKPGWELVGGEQGALTLTREQLKDGVLVKLRRSPSVTLHVTRRDEPLRGVEVSLPPSLGLFWPEGADIGTNKRMTDADGNARFFFKTLPPSLSATLFYNQRECTCEIDGSGSVDLDVCCRPRLAPKRGPCMVDGDYKPDFWKLGREARCPKPTKREGADVTDEYKRLFPKKLGGCSNVIEYKCP